MNRGRACAHRRALLLADTPFKDLGYDSLMVIEISFFLEESLKIEFGDRVTAQNLPQNLSDVVQLVRNLGQFHVEDEAVDVSIYGFED